MVDEHFDRLTRALSSRRMVLGLPLLGLATAPFAAVTDVKKRKKNKKKRCKGGKLRCGKKCVKSDTDRNNCGKCGNRCNGDLACDSGACVCQRDLCLVSAFSYDSVAGDLAIYPDGNIVAVFTDELRVFSPNGSLLETIGEFGDDPGEFDSPESVAIDTEGTLFVADDGNQRIQKIASNGNIDVWNQDGFPEGVAVGPAGTVYTTFDGQVHRLTATGEVSYSWGPDGTDTTEFDFPGELAVDTSGAVYVVDESANFVYRFTDGGVGNIQQDWASGGPGADPGEFDGPVGVAVDGGRVFVVDEGNDRMQALSAADGTFLFEWKVVVDGEEDEPRGVAVGPGGLIYVSALFNFAIFELG